MKISNTQTHPKEILSKQKSYPVSSPRVSDEPVLPSCLAVDSVSDDRDVVIDLRRVRRVVKHAAGVVLHKLPLNKKNNTKSMLFWIGNSRNYFSSRQTLQIGVKPWSSG